MKDYNFFTIYNRKFTQRIDYKSPYSRAVIAILAILLVAGGLGARNMLLAGHIERDTTALAAIQAGPDYLEALELHERKVTMDAYDAKASLALEKLENAKILGEDLLRDIAGKVPSVVSIDSIVMDFINLEITCTVPDRKAAAEFQLRLMELPFIGDVQLDSLILKDDGIGIEAIIKCSMVKVEAAE